MCTNGRGGERRESLSVPNYVCNFLPVRKHFARISPASPFPALASQKELWQALGHAGLSQIARPKLEKRCPGLSCSLQPVSLTPLHHPPATPPCLPTLTLLWGQGPVPKAALPRYWRRLSPDRFVPEPWKCPRSMDFFYWAPRYLHIMVIRNATPLDRAVPTPHDSAPLASEVPTSRARAADLLWDKGKLV